MPKGGTHYLREIVNQFSDITMLKPEMPHVYQHDYFVYSDTHEIPCTHCFSNLFEYLPETEAILLLLRDPRDIVLSLADFIEQNKWGGWAQEKQAHNWSELSIEEK